VFVVVVVVVVVEPPAAAMNLAAVVLNPLIFLHSFAIFCEYTNKISSFVQR
jgi:hypothetical protein